MKEDILMETNDWCDTCKFGELHYKEEPCCDCVYGVDGDVIYTNQYIPKIKKHYSALQLSNMQAAEEMEIQREVAKRQKTKVVNIRINKCDVYIGRGSKWGNPFIIGINGSRSEVIKMYREYILNFQGLMHDLPELKGKRLGCYCKPLPCHGDVLKELVDAIK